jgi:cell wall assembly regulator SMI1
VSIEEEFESWDQLEAALRRFAPEIVASFRPGASMDQILQTEELIGAQFPDFVRAAYLRHNGQVLTRRVADYLFIPFCHWLDLAEVNEFWREQRDANDDFLPSLTSSEIAYMSRIENTVIRNVSYHAGHVPIGASWTGVNFFLDLSPGAMGVRGQVFRGAADDFFPRKAEAESLWRYLRNFVDRLDEGSVAYSPKKGLYDPLTREDVLTVATPPKRR